jgi:hypothetical protein
VFCALLNPAPPKSLYLAENPGQRGKNLGPMTSNICAIFRRRKENRVVY